MYFFASFFISAFLTYGAMHLFARLGVVDRPNLLRKIHTRQIPLGGGAAIFLTVLLLVMWAFWRHDIGLTVTVLEAAGILFGGAILIIGGFVDDKYNLKARYQFIYPILAALAVIGVNIVAVTIPNPLGGTWSLTRDFFGTMIMVADIVTFFWLMGMMFTTKFLDGLDGLVGGVTAIGALMLFLLTQEPQWYNGDVSLLSLIFMGACLGFLWWNWHPARIFLGEGGSLFTGYMLAVLAIIAGGKIAATFLVVGVPALDLARVIVRRIERHQPVFVGDKEHLHFKLLDSGFSQRQAVLLLYSISFLFGAITLFVQQQMQLVAFSMVFILLMLIGVWFLRRDA